MSQEYKQTEFDFSEPKATEEIVQDYNVEITEGFDGEHSVIHTEFTGTASAVCEVIKTYGSHYYGYNETWTFSGLGDRTIVDFGSHTHFGRVTPCLK